MPRVGFPDGFKWGAGSSAHQVEGGNRWNDWWTFEQDGHIEGSGMAVDHYRRYAEDFALAKQLGHNAHRLSIEWSRIEKEQGHYDSEEIRHYAKVLAAAKDAGLEVFLTLHHFTNPQWLDEKGGWEWAGAADAFVAFVQRVVPELDQHVDWWTTFNEPTSHARLGYQSGEWAPGKRKGYLAVRRVLLNMAKAHRGAYEAIKDYYEQHHPGRDKPVGAVQACLHWRSDEQARGAARLFSAALVAPLTYLTNWYFLDHIRKHQDYCGVNYYLSLTASLNPQEAPASNLPKSDAGWDIVPEGIFEAVMGCWRRYRKPIVITENGVADAEDRIRWPFIKAHLRHLRRAMDAGADVRGYLHWSLTDNFEWAKGFGMRFGLVAIDYEHGLERTPRRSAWLFGEVARANGFEDSDLPAAEGRIEEYRTLREEISRHDSQILQVLTLSMTAAAAIVGFALKTTAGAVPDWRIILMAVWLLVPAGLMIFSRVQFLMRLGAYMQVFFERGEEGLRWERRLSKATAKSSLPEGLLVAAIVSVYVVVGVFGMALVWKYAHSAGRFLPGAEVPIVGTFVVAAVAGVFAIVMAALSRRASLEDGYVSILAGVRADELWDADLRRAESERDDAEHTNPGIQEAG